VVDPIKEKHQSRSVAYFPKDHQYVTEVHNQESRMRLIPSLNETFKGIYNEDSFFPGDVSKPPLFLLRSCRKKSGWCKHRLQATEVLRVYEISDWFSEELYSKFIALEYVSPLKVLLRSAHAVLKEVLGGGV
jgi:hypothetical protein